MRPRHLLPIRQVLLSATAGVCLALLPVAQARVDDLPCACPTSSTSPNPNLKIVDADLGIRSGDSGCDLAQKRTRFELNENVQLRLVVSGGRRLPASEAQIVVKWTDPDGGVVALPSLCLAPSDSFRTCARKRAAIAGNWQVTVTDCSGRALLTPLEFEVAP